MSKSGMSEEITKFSSNSEIIELINKLWDLSNQNNSKVEYILTLCTGETEDDVIVNLEHQIDIILEQDKSKIGGARKRRRVTKKRKGKSSKKSKKSRKNKKSYKKRK